MSKELKSKRVMGVLTVGLVAMLGAEAEAHYIVVAGKAKYCSVCVDVGLHGDEATPPHDEEVEVTVTTSITEYLCQNTIQTVTDQVALVVRTSIEQGDITHATDQNGTLLLTTTAEVKNIVVSDMALLVASNPSNPCGNVAPSDVLIRAMSLKIVYCDPGDLTLCKPLSTLQFEQCTLPVKFNFNNYPNKLPPVGTLYDCTAPIHIPPLP
jgi:hypothetical protein